MRYDGPGGVCVRATDLPQRTGNKTDEAGKREAKGEKGEEWMRARQSAEQCPLPLHGRFQTGSDYSLPGGGSKNGAVQRATLCVAHPPRTGRRGLESTRTRRGSREQGAYLFQQ